MGLLVQIQQVKRDGEGNIIDARFCAQKEVSNTEDIEKFREDAEKEYELSEGWSWFCCGERSKYFLVMREE